MDTKEALDDANAMDKLFSDDPYGKLNDAKVAFLIKMWAKASLAVRDSGTYTTLKTWLNKRGDPGKPSDTNPMLSWTDSLVSDLRAFKRALGDGSEEGIRRTWKAATDTMVAFVEDYRNKYKRGSNQDLALAHQVRVAFLALDKELAPAGR